MWKYSYVLFFAAAIFVDDAAASIFCTAKSGVETRVYFHRGNTAGGIDEATKFKIERPPANGTARIVMTNLSSGTGKPIRIAEVFYKSKRGFVGSDSLSYQRINRNGSVDNFTLSVNVVP